MVSLATIFTGSTGGGLPLSRYFATQVHDQEDIDEGEFLELPSLVVQNSNWTNMTLPVSGATNETFTFPASDATGVLRIELFTRKQPETGAAAEFFTAVLETADGVTEYARAGVVVISSSTSTDSYNPTVFIPVEYRGLIPAGTAFRVRFTGIQTNDEVQVDRVVVSFDEAA